MVITGYVNGQGPTAERQRPQHYENILYPCCGVTIRTPFVDGKPISNHEHKEAK